jgi:hypothetical protein
MVFSTLKVENRESNLFNFNLIFQRHVIFCMSFDQNNWICYCMSYWSKEEKYLIYSFKNNNLIIFQKLGAKDLLFCLYKLLTAGTDRNTCMSVVTIFNILSSYYTYIIYFYVQCCITTLHSIAVNDDLYQIFWTVYIKAMTLFYFTTSYTLIHYLKTTFMFL